MAQFIAPIVENVLAVLKKNTPGTVGNREPFADFGKAFTGVVQNWPSVYVMPARTSFDADSQHMRHQAHELQVKIAVSGGDPDDLIAAAVDYMKAVDLAIDQSFPADWQAVLTNGVVTRVFVSSHDYGPLFEKGGGFARFPEVDLIVETEEL